MNRIVLLLLHCITFFVKAQEKPKLVVGIVVDQMRQDYLQRFSHQFSAGGFKRLLGQGFHFKNMHYNYIPTYTAPGHASIYTGTTPSQHGIIGNSWYSREKGLDVYCVSDLNASSVGGTERHGKVSPKNLQVTTITDELMMATNFRSKVVGISIKDRGSILPAGHNPTGAYWFDSSTGQFMTSDYYAATLPEWVAAFNETDKIGKYLEQTWTTMNDLESYDESSEDDVPYERSFKGVEKPAFPYDMEKLAETNGPGLIRTTPWGNVLVMDLALAALEGEQLGKDQITDFLTISFSSTDYIGHAFGPNSVELQDTYLRLDLEIKRLLDELDKRFGEDYLVFLTADHGVSQIPLFLSDKKFPAGYINEEQSFNLLKSDIEDRFGESNLILKISNDQIFLDRDIIRAREEKLEDVQAMVTQMALSLPEVFEAYTATELAKRAGTSWSRNMLENGYHMKLSGDVLIRLKSGYLSEGYGREGTSHGSGYTYDTHVPAIFFGQGVRPGESVRAVSITDIAPTISMLLDISLPSAATGSPLLELFE